MMLSSRGSSTCVMHFGRERESNPFCWEVPMGRDLDVMPWLSKRSTGVTEAIHRARTARGKTALLIDNSVDKVVDTFFMYRSTQILEAKQMVVDERMRKKSRAQILESARQRLVNAMRYGQTLYIRMSNTATSFKQYYTSPTTLPLAVFDQACIDSLRSLYTPPAGDNLFGSSHPLAGALREADTEHGFFQCRHGFEVVVSTHLAKDDVGDLLGRALPMDKLQPIVPLVKPRRQGGPIEFHGAQQSTPESTDAEERAWTSVEEAHEAAVRLRERVEAARERRAGRGASTSVSNRSGGSTRDDSGLCSKSKDVHPRPQDERSLVSTSCPQQFTIVPADADDAPPPVTRCFASPNELDRERRMQPVQQFGGSNTDLLQTLQRTLSSER